MSVVVGAYEAKTHLPRLLAEVEAGAVVTITKHGREVARLVPVGRPASSVAEAIADLVAARTGVGGAGGPVREMIDEGRR